jgi:hypothetical protein
MSLSDIILEFDPLTLSVQRHNVGSIVDGEYVPAAPSTFTIQACIQPAFNLNRVVGGADLHALVDLQKVTEVRQLYTATELRTRTPQNDPDVILMYEEASWTVARVEKWPDLDGGYFYHVVITKVTGGAA